MKRKTNAKNSVSRKRLIKLLIFGILFAVFLSAPSTESQAATTYKTIKVTSAQIKEDGAAKAIQAALDKAASKATSKKQYKVVVAAGTYTLNDSLNIYSNTYLYVKGCTFKLKSGNDNNMIKVGDKEDTTATGYYYKNITIYGGTWNANGNDNTVIKIGHASNVTVSNATFKNVKNAHLMEVAGVKDLTITKCTFKDQTITNASTADDESIVTNEAIQIDILTSKHFTGYLSEDLTNKNITITSCTFSNVPRGIGSHTAVLNNPINGLTIKNNTFKNLTSCGIQLIAVKNCTISGNTMTNVPRGIYIYSYVWTGTYTGSYLKKENKVGSATSSSYKTPSSSNIIISNNKITMKGSDAYAEYENAGIWLQGFSLSKNTKYNGSTIKKGNYYLTGVTVKNNTITTTGQGIRLSDVYNSTISNNTITGPGSTKSAYYGISTLGASKKNTISGNTIKKFYRGIYIYNKSTVKTIENNKMSSIGNNGIMISASTVTKVKSNTITSPKSNGIYVSDSSTVSYIKSNTIKTASKNGILAEDSTVKYIQLNTISSAGNNGIYIYDGSSSSTIESNKITSPSKQGINIEASKVTKIKNNTISSPKSNGVYVYNKSTVNYIKGNTIKTATKNGILSEASTVKYIQSNTISSAKNNGIYIYSSSTSTTIESNNITSPAKQGVNVEASKVTKIKNNTISTPSSNGVYVYKNSTVSYIKGNTIKTAAKNGILSEGSTVKYIQSNTISSAKNNGIYIYSSSSSTTIESNKITSPAKYGIDVEGSTVTNVKNNTISSSGGNGIYLYKSAVVTSVNGNTVSSSSNNGILVEGSTATNITSNTISGASNNGIYVYSSSKSSYVKSNKISSAGKYGVVVENSTATYIQSNEISKPTSYGIMIFNSAKTSEISSNKITDGSSRGIFLSSLKCALKISSNTVSNCGSDYLIYLNPSTTSYTITVSSNALTGSSNSQIGIRADSGTIVIQSNTIKSCSYAVQLLPDVKGTIYTNSLSGNTAAYRIGSADIDLSKPSVIVEEVTDSTVTLSWDQIEGTGYEIYRASSSDGTYTLIAKVSDDETISYTDTDLSAGTTYYYKIRAYRSTTNSIVYGDYSTKVSGTTSNQG